MYGTVRVNCMTLVGGDGGSLHDGCGLCTNLGRWGSGVGRVLTEYDGVRRTLTGGFLFLGDLAGFGRLRGVTIGANHKQELYGR